MDKDQKVKVRHATTANRHANNYTYVEEHLSLPEGKEIWNGNKSWVYSSVSHAYNSHHVSCLYRPSFSKRLT